MDCFFHSASSHAGIIMTTSKGLSVAVEQARACRTAFLVHVGAYSGTARHGPSIGSYKLDLGHQMWHPLEVPHNSLRLSS
jgi:hypothetical protein